MNKHILYVEDDETLAFLTKDALEEEGFALIHISDGAKALEMFKEKSFDLCIIDVMLPSMDGFTLAESIRALNSQIPIIFLTAKSLKEDRIKGLSIGADDYITKPFSIEELILKINVFLKRRFINEVDNKIIDIGSLHFDFKNLKLYNDKETHKLTQREGELLYHIANCREELVPRKTLLERVWGRDDYFLGRSMDVFISRLRKHLSLDPNIKLENQHGVGYRIVIKNN